MKGKICVVTGASRGVGQGIALALGTLGATVYVTGRSRQNADSLLGDTIDTTAANVTALGGQGIAAYCDHGDTKSVAAFFDRVRQEQGHIDVLVNNAIALPDELTLVKPFWQKSLGELALIDVGMRSNYVSTWHAAPLLLELSGLVVFTSSFGGTCYMHGPAYGAGKAGTDKMAHDMAVDFRPYGVTTVSLWLGLVKTPRTIAVCDAEPEKYGPAFKVAESPEFAGRVIAALYGDPQRHELTGTIQVAAELAKRYEVTDLNECQPPSYRRALGNPPEFSAAVVE